MRCNTLQWDSYFFADFNQGRCPNSIQHHILVSRKKQQCPLFKQQHIDENSAAVITYKLSWMQLQQIRSEN